MYSKGNVKVVWNKKERGAAFFSVILFVMVTLPQTAPAQSSHRKRWTFNMVAGGKDEKEHELSVSRAIGFCYTSPRIRLKRRRLTLRSRHQGMKYGRWKHTFATPAPLIKYICVALALYYVRRVYSPSSRKPTLIAIWKRSRRENGGCS